MIRIVKREPLEYPNLGLFRETVLPAQFSATSEAFAEASRLYEIEQMADSKTRYMVVEMTVVTP